MGREEGEERAESLEDLRQEISRLDEELLSLLVQRQQVARRIGRAKRMRGLPIQDLERQAAVVRRVGERSREMGLDDEAVRYLFWQVMAMARSVQEEGGL